MKLDIQAVDFKLHRKLEKLIEDKLARYARKHSWIVGAEVYLKPLKTHDHKNKQLEIKLNIPGNDLFAKAVEEKFEIALDKVDEALIKQLTKFKERDLIKPRVNPLKAT